MCFRMRPYTRMKNKKTFPLRLNPQFVGEWVGQGETYPELAVRCVEVGVNGGSPGAANWLLMPNTISAVRERSRLGQCMTWKVGIPVNIFLPRMGSQTYMRGEEISCRREISFANLMGYGKTRDIRRILLLAGLNVRHSPGYWEWLTERARMKTISDPGSYGLQLLALAGEIHS